MGRPSKTLAQKILAGTTQPCRIAVGLDGHPVGDVDPPENFNDDQKRYWYELFDMTNEVGAITRSDLGALNALTIAYTRMMTDPDSMSIHELKGVTSLLGKFGCTPADHRAVTPIQKKESSALEQLRAKRKAS